MSELLPCPFCGGEAEKLTSTDGFTSIGCLNCNPFLGVMLQRGTEAEAIAAWNSRAERTCKREKHGRKMDGSWRMRCSECGYGIGDKRWSYCPSCGAKVVD